MICNYGCGKEALFTLSNGKFCCESSYNKCSEIKNKNSKGLKKAYQEGRKINSHIKKGKMCGWDNWTYLGNGESKYKYTKDEIFCIGSTYSTIDLKKRIIEENIFEYKCSSCNISVWNNKPISLEIDHINGNCFDNTIENLRFLCPNCHSQTENFRGRNINSGKTKVSDEVLIESLKSTKNIRQALIKVGLAAKGFNYIRAEKLLKASVAQLVEQSLDKR